MRCVSRKGKGLRKGKETGDADHCTAFPTREPGVNKSREGQFDEEEDFLAATSLKYGRSYSDTQPVK